MVILREDGALLYHAVIISCKDYALLYEDGALLYEDCAFLGDGAFLYEGAYLCDGAFCCEGGHSKLYFQRLS